MEKCIKGMERNRKLIKMNGKKIFLKEKQIKINNKILMRKTQININNKILGIKIKRNNKKNCEKYIKNKINKILKIYNKNMLNLKTNNKKIRIPNKM